MLASVALLFHSAEYFALMVVGLSAIAAFAGTGQVAKALMMTVLGLIMATVGEGALFNLPRFTMGIMDPPSRVSASLPWPWRCSRCRRPCTWCSIPSRSESGAAEGTRSGGCASPATRPGRSRRVVGRQSLQGFLIGVMPGAGATIASFLGYAVERNIAPKEEREAFGKGSIKGLAAPEAANNAACTGSFVPLLTLGIPGSGTTAILLGALIALNVSPGPRLMVDQPQIFWAVIISMYLGNLILLGSEPAAHPLYRKGAGRSAELSHPLHPVLHPDGGLYRAEQRHRAAAAWWGWASARRSCASPTTRWLRS